MSATRTARPSTAGHLKAAFAVILALLVPFIMICFMMSTIRDAVGLQPDSWLNSAADMGDVMKAWVIALRDMAPEPSE